MRIYIFLSSHAHPHHSEAIFRKSPSVPLSIFHIPANSAAKYTKPELLCRIYKMRTLFVFAFTYLFVLRIVAYNEPHCQGLLIEICLPACHPHPLSLFSFLHLPDIMRCRTLQRIHTVLAHMSSAVFCNLRNSRTQPAYILPEY